MNDENNNGQGRGMPPLRTLRDGSLSSTIWPQDSVDGDRFFTSEIVRNWQDDHGKWHKSSSFSERDLPRLMALIETTQDVIRAQHFEMTPERVSEQSKQKAAYQQERRNVSPELRDESPRQQASPRIKNGQG